MPVRSEFDAQLGFARKVKAKGSLTLDQPAGARGGSMFVLWMVQQDSRAGGGVTRASGATWAQEEAEEQGWNPGPAHAVGALIDPDTGQVAFIWTQQVTLVRS